MSTSSLIWRLPGPNGFVREIKKSARRGQHVAAVLPRAYFEEHEHADWLLQELLDHREEIEQLTPESGESTLTEAIGSAAYIDDPPVTARRLLAHEDVAGRRFVISASELSKEYLDELPEFLRRLDADSRSLPADERATFVLLVGPAAVGELTAGERSDVALEQHWFWNRASRWDVAALLALQDREDQRESLLAEVRMETIIEAAHWDFDLAVDIANGWSGEFASLLDFMDSKPCLEAVDFGTYRRENLRRPPESHVDAWDDGALGFWHDAITVAPARRTLDATGVGRVVWSAQARVLLPWVEVRRERLARRVEVALGEDTYRAYVKRYARADHEDVNDEVVEIGTLAHLIGKVHPRPQFLETAHTLRRARNSLAHLTPMTDLEIRRMVERCQWLS